MNAVHTPPRPRHRATKAERVANLRREYQAEHLAIEAAALAGRLTIEGALARAALRAQQFTVDRINIEQGPE